MYSVGDYVKDYNGNKGIIVKIEKGTSVSDHGYILVWQNDRYEVGIDNCESFAEFELYNQTIDGKKTGKKFLKILKKATREENNYYCVGDHVIDAFGG